MSYATLAQFKAAVGITDSTDDAALQQLQAAASGSSSSASASGSAHSTPPAPTSPSKTP